MKRFIALLLVIVMCVSLASCGLFVNIHAIKLADKEMEVEGLSFAKNVNYQAFLNKLERFASKLTASANERYGQTENFVISPVSVYMALALAIECADGETRDELLDAVGVSYEQVEEYTKYLYAFCNREEKFSPTKLKKSCIELLNNSIWVADDINYNKDGVNKLASDYNCDVFKVSFKNGQANRLIGQYIKNKTRGLIDGKVNYSPETAMVLMNTFYLKEIWKRLGKELKYTQDIYGFKNTDGSMDNVKLLQGEYVRGQAYEGEGFTSFYSKTYNGFRLYFFVPDVNIPVSDIFTEQNIAKVMSIEEWNDFDEELNEIHGTRILFPKFDVSFNEDITDLLREDFKINRFFDRELCDISNIGEDLYCNTVIHKCTLKVDETGLEGAAVTEISLKATSPGPVRYLYHDLIVDRAFGFVLTDEYGTLLFSGVINNID